MKKFCYKCKCQIDEKENYCSLNSYFKGKEVHVDYFHAQCFRSWIEDKLDKKIKEYADKMMKTAMPYVEQYMGG